jgi:hypothetical protein
MRRLPQPASSCIHLSRAALGVALAAGLAGCATASTKTAQASGQDALPPWPLPPDWKAETLAFPLDFAPGIRHTGMEELRFAPGFFKPTAPGYFSYAFVWWLADAQPLPAVALADELRQYYAGLCTAVGGKKYAFDPAHYRVQLSPVADSMGGWEALSGQADLYDAFTNGQPISLHVLAYQRACGSHRAVLVLASPQAEPAPIMAELRAVGQSFHCP